jgi:hypothetical protein
VTGVRPPYAHLAVARLLSVLVAVLVVLLTCAGGCSTNETTGNWTITNPPGACPAPAMVQANGSCSTPQGTSCKSEMPRFDCSGLMVGFVGCTCTAGTWVCGAPTVPGCPDGGDDATTGEGGDESQGPGDASDETDAAAGCPPETLVESGAACAVPQTLTCKSAAHTFDCDAQVNGYVSCTCVSGTWVCGPSSTCADGGADAAADAAADGGSD